MREQNGYVPVHVYARKKGVSRQNVYRWIREGKIAPSDVKREVIEVVRIRIKL